MLKVLQISDCHLVVSGTNLLGVDTQATLESVLADAVATHTPDAVIASGDIAHDPGADVYARFIPTIRRFTDAPVLTLPGNHDLNAAMSHAELPQQPLHVGEWGLVGLDSHEDDSPSAQVTAADKQDCERDMQALADARHILLATHFHLLPVNCPWLDRDRVQNPQDLLKWLRQASADRLRGCVFGHIHQEVEGMVAVDAATQVPVWGVPSTCFQFLPRSPTFAVDALGPGYRWLYLQNDGSVRTEVKRTAATIEVDMSQFKH